MAYVEKKTKTIIIIIIIRFNYAEFIKKKYKY